MKISQRENLLTSKDLVKINKTRNHNVTYKTMEVKGGKDEDASKGTGEPKSVERLHYYKKYIQAHPSSKQK